MKHYEDIVDELQAKAHQSTRRRGYAEDHVCWRAAKEIVRLRELSDASEAEKGWRCFWKGFSDFLNLDREQSRYSWHDLMEACSRGMAAVKRDLLTRTT